MLMRCSPLLLLSMLQLVVLSGIVAAYIYTNSYTPSATRQTVSQFTTTLRGSAPGHERIASSNVKPGVILKPISLTYLRANLAKVFSRVDFIRLFADADIQDHHINHLISRTIRSASHSTSRHPHMKQTRHTDDDGADFSGVGENIGGIDILNDNFMSFETLSAAENSVSDDASNAADHVYDYDYPQDEPSSDDFEAFEAALHHIEEMKTCSKSKCQHPTPFVLNVRDKHDSSRVFLPECVVLHRCMNSSGCCGDRNHECVPKSMNTVVKSFLVVNRLALDHDEVTFDAHMATTLYFVNHTECECREKPKLPRCTKLCPRHFRLSQEGANCVCDCFPLEGHDPWPCESVKDGLNALPTAAGLECINSGECYKPRCTEGEFDDVTGYCPLSNEYALPAFMFEKATDRYHYREHLHNFDFTTPHWRGFSVTKGSLISPTPSSKNDALFANNIDKLGDTEKLLPQGDQMKSATLFESEENQYFSNTRNSSVQLTQNVSDISETSNINVTDSNSNFSIATNDQPSQTEAHIPSQTPANELHSSIYPSYGEEHADADDDDYNDYSNDYSSHELTEGQGVIDSTSRVKGLHTGGTTQEIVSPVSVASTAFPARVVRTEDTGSEGRTSQNELGGFDLTLSSSAGDSQDIDNGDENDDDVDDDDDDEYIDTDVVSENDYADSSYKDYPSTSTDYYRDSDDLSRKNQFKEVSSSADYHTDSSPENSQRDSSSVDDNKDSLSKDHDKNSSNKEQVRDPSFGDRPKNSLGEEHYKDSSVGDYNKDSLFNDHHKYSSVGGHHKDSTNKHHHKDPSNKDHHKDPSKKDQFREEGRTSLHNKQKHKFQTDSQFHGTVQSHSKSEKGQTGIRNIHSEARLFIPSSTIPSTDPSFFSTSSTKLPMNSGSSQPSSSSAEYSSVSSQPSSPLSKLSSLFSLTKHSQTQDVEASTKTLVTNNQDLKTSTDKSLLRRL